VSRTAAQQNREKQVRAWVKWLKKHFPAPHPVRVYFRDHITNSEGNPCTGYAVHNKKSTSIFLAHRVRGDEDCNWREMKDSLIEEWVHTRLGHLTDEHTPTFYAQWGEITSAWQGVESGE
jgi:hypothetical protein